MRSIDRDALLQTLKIRFETHPHRHNDIAWAAVQAKLERTPTAIRALHEMESSGGEPDVITCDAASGEYTFCDCSPESPASRRSLCYDAESLASRKENKPKGSAMDVAVTMGISLLSEDEYRHLQTLGEFDLKTSSWIATPSDIRSRGGALFCDRRYGKVFTYHNGAESYYAARGFRGILRV